jgi:phospho-N-acetylmuramoyl-pentapeptide-transferase
VWGRLDNLPLLGVCLITVLFAAIGFWDDYKKLVLKHSDGLAARYKYLWQSVFALFAAFWLVRYFPAFNVPLDLNVPYWHVLLPLGTAGFIILTYFVIAGSSNAVNLTDGLDGLVIVPVMLS